MEKKQTVLSLIAENFNLLSDKDFKSWFLNRIDYLKQLEKQQIKNAYIKGQSDCEVFTMESESEQYYTETYNTTEPI